MSSLCRGKTVFLMIINSFDPKLHTTVKAAKDQSRCQDEGGQTFQLLMGVKHFS